MCCVVAAYGCLGFRLYVLAAQEALPPSTRPRILLDAPTEEQPSYQPAGRGPEAGRRKDGEFGTSLSGKKGDGVVICPPFREGYPSREKATNCLERLTFFFIFIDILHSSINVCQLKVKRSDNVIFQG